MEKTITQAGKSPSSLVQTAAFPPKRVYNLTNKPFALVKRKTPTTQGYLVNLSGTFWNLSRSSHGGYVRCYKGEKQVQGQQIIVRTTV